MRQAQGPRGGSGDVAVVLRRRYDTSCIQLKSDQKSLSQYHQSHTMTGGHSDAPFVLDDCVLFANRRMLTSLLSLLTVLSAALDIRAVLQHGHHEDSQIILGHGRMRRLRRKARSGKKKTLRRRYRVQFRSRQSGPTPERYREIQQALVDKGYLKSEPNGVWDANRPMPCASFRRTETYAQRKDQCRQSD